MTTPPPTRNVGFVIPDETSLMSDVTTYLNNNWTLVETVLGAARIVSSVPDEDITTYQVGDRIWVSGGTDPNGLYFCVGIDSNWGAIWRPVNIPYGPWRRPGRFNEAVIFDRATFTIDDADSPFQYRLSNNGRIEFRGCIKCQSGLYVPTISSVGYNALLFKTLPPCIQPGWKGFQDEVVSTARYYHPTLQCSPFPVTSSPTEGQYCNVQYDWDNSSFAYRFFSNISNTTNRLYFSGANYNIGSMDLDA